MILSANEFRWKLEPLNLSKVARDCDMAYPTILRIAKGDIKSCKYETLEKVSNYLNASN